MCNFTYEVNMQAYKDINNDSGVIGFDISDDRITVWFNGAPQPYTYSYASAGQAHVENMKKLAISGDGLNAYINRHVKFKYVR
ncbi:hypothetical protein C3B79_2871 [Aeromonas hydrophila]|nr:hypothetical protein C3B79_2871 [Aeromonas hydrophila]